jgi:ABC-2 type transport system ATP-binding protein
VAGLLEATSGEVTLDGEDILNRPERAWERLGYLPQEFGFYPHLTGEQMLLYLLHLKGVQPAGGMKAYCAELLERVNLTFAARRRVKSYSGGMRQRLGIAQTIAGDPRLIIVDEPTAGLDPEERLRLYRILAELAEDRIVLLSTHIVEDVGVLCPRFAVIRQGQLVTETTPGQARAAIEGMIFEGEATSASLEELRTTRCVTQAILVEGKNRVRMGALVTPLEFQVCQRSVSLFLLSLELYDLPRKYTIALANKFANDSELSTSEFSGGEQANSDG